MSPELIAAYFTGITGIIAAVSAFTAARSRKVAEEQRKLRKRVRDLENGLVALMSHTFTLELSIARAGGHVPPRPPILEKLAEDEDLNV